jgi:hypothetical protein
MFFWCHSIDLKFPHKRSGLVCFYIFVFVSNFSIFASVRSELRIEKGRLNLSWYGAHLQDILLLFMFIITEDPVKKNGAKVTEELRIVVFQHYSAKTTCV